MIAMGRRSALAGGSSPKGFESESLLIAIPKTLKDIKKQKAQRITIRWAHTKKPTQN
jgi:hypothetical protein